MHNTTINLWNVRTSRLQFLIMSRFCLKVSAQCYAFGMCNKMCKTVYSFILHGVSVFVVILNVIKPKDVREREKKKTRP